jgi:hypothetical protein
MKISQAITHSYGYQRINVKKIMEIIPGARQCQFVPDI